MKRLFGFTDWPDSPNRRIFRAAFVVALVGLLVKGVTALKELAIARVFGRSDAIDSYLIAYLVPAFAVILLMGAFSSCVIPVIIHLRQEKGTEAAQRLFSSTLLLTLGTLAVLAIALGLGAPFFLRFLGSGFSAEKLQLTRYLFYWLLPFVLFSGLSTFATSVLNARERFALPACVALITPAVTIFLIAICKPWGVLSLVAGTAGGSALEAIVLFGLLKTHGMQLIPKWYGFDSPLRRVLQQMLPMVAGAFLMGGTAIVDQSMAAMLLPGSVAALSYGNKAVGFIVAIGATALSTATLPYLSQMAARSDWQGCRHTIKRYISLVAVTTVPIMIGLMVFSRPLVSLLFQRGAFSSADTELVSRVQFCYAIQIPFYIGSILFVRFLHAMRRNEILMCGSAINLVLDIILNLVLMKRFGVAGIALSTSLVYLVSLAFLAISSIRILHQRDAAEVNEISEPVAVL